jgi:hypothetical protein
MEGSCEAPSSIEFVLLAEMVGERKKYFFSNEELLSSTNTLQKQINRKYKHKQKGKKGVLLQ